MTTGGAARARARSHIDAQGRKARALPLLVAGHSASEVERLTDGIVTVRMLRRWMEPGEKGYDAEFCGELERVRAEALEAARRMNEERRDAGVADALEVQRFLTQMMRGEIGGEAKDRNKAAELLGRVHGLFVERKEVDVRSASVTAVVAFASPDEAVEIARAHLASKALKQRKDG